MKPSDIASSLQLLTGIQKPAFLWGPPGVGKSQIVAQVAALLDLRLIDIRAILLDPVDLRGLPTVEQGRAAGPGCLIGAAARGATGGRGWRARWRPPLSGTLDDVPRHISLLLFVLFMLAATTYDGVWRTSFWAGLYWSNLMQWLRSFWGDDTARAQALLAPGYVVYQRGGLIAAPFAYLAVYMAAMVMMGVLTRGRVAARMLTLRFGFTIIPIAVVYMLAHSWTLLLTVIPVVPFLLTDPFGAGWNMLALSRMSAEPAPLDMGQVWHAEVALILAGHVAGVYLAHRVALGTFATRRQAWISELPLLLLMMGYTFIGLTVLSLPLALH
jgi:hypothetical protein